jgi:siroheme synthase
MWANAAAAPALPRQTLTNSLFTSASEGKQVVRLKSGDPFIFGRTASEIQALKAAHCAYEVVPGLSSALAGPLLAGIPLTDPVLGSNFAVLTAHDLELHNWEALAQLATLVILMGGRHLPQIQERLLHWGKRPETPIAVIRWASQPQQQIWSGTLLNIAQQVRGEKLSPCIIVIGEVAALRAYLQPGQWPVICSRFSAPANGGQPG